MIKEQSARGKTKEIQISTTSLLSTFSSHIQGLSVSNMFDLILGMFVYVQEPVPFFSPSLSIIKTAGSASLASVPESEPRAG